MLAQRISKIATWSMIVLFISMTTETLVGQQAVRPPSQRYEPSQTQLAPPSAHVPPAGLRRLQGNNRLRMNLSDQSNSYPTQQGMIAQTSYQEPAGSATPVPAILAGQPAPTTQPAATSAARAASSKTMQQYAAQMNQMRSNGPSVKPIQRAPLRTAATQFAAPPQSQNSGLQITPRTKSQTTTQAATSTQAPAVKPMAAPRVAEPTSVQQSATTTQATSVPAPARTAAPAFVAQETAATTATKQPATQQPVAKQVTNTAAMRPAATSQRTYDRNVRPASREVTSIQKDQPAISSTAPSIQVETFGPPSIGVNKAASFRVEVTNTSRIDAKDVQVGISLPDWVEVPNSNLTAGQKSLSNEPDMPRMIWTIDSIPAGKTHSATLTAIPRKPEMFDVVVEWTLVPRVGSVNIQVTEPKLEMTMSGPSEVLFGETVSYKVTIRNPGTGDAENVVVMLPEELGGDRQAIGNIKAGKQEEYDIELAARTSGALKLVTSATADGKLSTSAQQDVTVRRALLDIKIEGPAMKYSGTKGRYKISVTNVGDATANELETGILLPQGVDYLGGIDSVVKANGGIRWPVGSLTPNQSRTYEIECELNGAGELTFETGIQSKGDGEVEGAAAACITNVETIADLVLSVQDPKGPLPTGEETTYQITVQNRGSKSARSVELLMQFSEGIEPSKAVGLQSRIVPGQVIFAPISQIDPGQELTFEVTAIANKRGTHVFRAFLSCDDSDSREVAEGTTKFFGDEFQIESNRTAEAADQRNGSSDFK
jgi:hypothetical protein